MTLPGTTQVRCAAVAWVTWAGGWRGTPERLRWNRLPNSPSLPVEQADPHSEPGTPSAGWNAERFVRAELGYRVVERLWAERAPWN